MNNNFTNGLFSRMAEYEPETNSVDMRWADTYHRERYASGYDAFQSTVATEIGSYGEEECEW